MTDTTIAQFVRDDVNCALESGTYLGETTSLLASVPALEQVHSVELSPQLYESARARFAGQPRVRLWLGDSGERFAEALDEIERTLDDPRLLVFCDGHYSGGETARGNVASPLRRELEVLAGHGAIVKSVLIDDVRVCFEPGGNPLYTEGWPDSEELNDLLADINPGFRIRVDHQARPLSILVADAA